MGSARVANDVRRPFYAGATLHVRSYDSINRSDRPVLLGDISFFLDLARRAGGDVLEVGVGTGRVAVELAKSGIQVIGLDLSADMLAIAAEKATTSDLTQRGADRGLPGRDWCRAEPRQYRGSARRSAD